MVGSKQRTEYIICNTHLKQPFGLWSIAQVNGSLQGTYL